MEDITLLSNIHYYVACVVEKESEGKGEMYGIEDVSIGNKSAL